MQVPVLNGIYTDNAANIRTSYPVNLIPVPKQSGVSAGYLRPADGILELGTGPGVDRGGYNWNGVCYRVMGTSLVRIAEDGTTTILGDVGAGGQVRFAHSFYRLAIASGGRLYYWDNATLVQTFDIDFGTVIDVIWVDGYFMTTDGTSLVVTELNNPMDVNPLKYGSSEVDPDSIKAVIKLRDEPYAINRYTIEVFSNIGGELFPFQRIPGAMITKGAVGTRAVAIMSDALVFLGSGRNEGKGESLAIYVGLNGNTTKISTDEIDRTIAEYTEAQLADTVMEVRVDKGMNMLYVHLPDRTLVYDVNASKATGEQVWFVLTSSLAGFAQYRARNMVYAYGKWLSGDPTTSKHGHFTEAIASHYGVDVRCEFGTMVMYNEGRGAIIHELELVGITGRVAAGKNPIVHTSYSFDGMTWSADKGVRIGILGDRSKRLVWFNNGTIRSVRMQRFRFDSQSFLSIARLEARLEALSV